MFYDLSDSHYTKARAIVRARVRDFVADGYIQERYVMSKQFFCIHLRHEANGNVIVISGSPMRNTMKQTTNGHTVYDSSIVFDYAI